MHKNKFKLFIILMMSTVIAFGAKPVQLDQQSLQLFLAKSSLVNNPSQLQIMSSSEDFNHTAHQRFKQKWMGYPVWGADVAVHSPSVNKASSVAVNGLVYEGLAEDLKNTPAYIFTPAHRKRVLQYVINSYQQKISLYQTPRETKVKTIVFVDKENKAHWAFVVSFVMELENTLPVKPVCIVDAINFKVYQQWDGIHTFDQTTGGGWGGNQKVGKMIYDGLPGHTDPLTIERDVATGMCYLKNNEVVVKNFSRLDVVTGFRCDQPSLEHNQVYWNGESDSINGAYSPSNDALFAGSVIIKMYKSWYGIPVLKRQGQPMRLSMHVHKKMSNAYWDGREMAFGDGGDEFFPLVSVGVAAHEISHGFTQQHANLLGPGQAGGLNESFSDMAAQAALFYLNGRNNWQIGSEITKEKNRALRYMDNPTKDCEGDKPGTDCSIEHIKDYHEGLDVHFSAGIFNKVFYLLATAPGWDTKKAFDVMVQANRHYWVPQTDFNQAACGVAQAAKDYRYDKAVVEKAFAAVGIALGVCR